MCLSNIFKLKINKNYFKRIFRRMMRALLLRLHLKKIFLALCKPTLYYCVLLYIIWGIRSWFCMYVWKLNWTGLIFKLVNQKMSHRRPAIKSLLSFCRWLSPTLGSQLQNQVQDKQEQHTLIQTCNMHTLGRIWNFGLFL